MIKNCITCIASMIGLIFLCGTVLAQPTTNQAGAGFGGGGGRGNQPNYPFPYRPATADDIKGVMDRVLSYIDANTAAQVIDRQTNQPVTDFSKANVADLTLEQKPLLINSYEWGVTYAGLILASEATGDAKYKDYVDKRFQIFGHMLPLLRAQATTQPAATQQAFDPAAAARAGGFPGGAGGRGFGGRGGGGLGQMLNPNSLDASGAMCAALIKARRASVGPDLLAQINVFMDWVHTKQFRFSDGTLARTRPHPETLWLDDLYMSVPALSQMGKLTGDRQYYDDAAKQIVQFSKRMFVPEKGLWLHGWTSNTEDHPAFYWARANGWAVMAMVELLEVLPQDHPQRAEVLKILQAHIKGLAHLQSGDGLWHQLLDRPDSYLETSASSMFVFAMARAINRGWVSAVTYGPVAQIGWQAVTTKVNSQGQVEGTCVGTDLAFDPAYYYYRPTSPLAAHGYGPLFLAGAEMTSLIKNKNFSTTAGPIHQTEPGANPFGGGGGGGRGRGRGRGGQ